MRIHCPQHLAVGEILNVLPRDSYLVAFFAQCYLLLTRDSPNEVQYLRSGRFGVYFPAIGSELPAMRMG